MDSITIDKARNLLLGCNARLVAKEQPRCYYDNFSGAIELKTYLSNDCLVIRTNGDWTIHALSKQSDIISSIEEIEQAAAPNESIFALTWNNIPEELKDKKGSYKFSREWQPYTDSQIRALKTISTRFLLAAPSIRTTMISAKISVMIFYQVIQIIVPTVLFATSVYLTAIFCSGLFREYRKINWA